MLFATYAFFALNTEMYLLLWGWLSL